jgi:hypothetical protein
MTPQEKDQVQEYVRELAKIFYRNTPSEKCQSLEEIEQAVRGHLLESVGPDIALFLSNREPKPSEEKSE